MTIMAGSGAPVLRAIEDTAEKARGEFVLVCEGAFPEDPFCTMGERDGKPVPITERAAELAEQAAAVIAVGACATFGGIPAAEPNPTGARPIGKVMEERGINTPLINIPGCPPHPDWFTGTLINIMLKGLPDASELDELRRPLAYFGKLIHENCPRRPYFDAGKFAKKPGDEGCLYLLGCKGPVTYADCPIRMWNTGVNWCVGAGAPCNGCVEPEFPDKLSPLYEKLTEERLERFKIACNK